jgi:SAM-dependent methyltransferase
VDEQLVQTDRLTNRERQLVDYYDQLADNYDSNRFGNSYGRYVDAQERQLLKRWLNQVRGGTVLDLACGSGRLLDLASCGLDASPAMVRIARRKHPEKDVRCGLAKAVAEFGRLFDAIFCAHLFMHLQRTEIEAVLRSCHEQLRPDGLLIFDAPSAHRRKLTGFQSSGWHAGTALTFDDVAAIAGSKWQLKASRGILFFPVHRLPSGTRPLVRRLDDFIGMTPAKTWSSYLFFCLERKQ